jgi:hypothetical protein
VSDSFIRGGTIRRITRLVGRAHETEKALAGGGQTVVFYRFNADLNKRMPVAPQTVLVEFANTQVRTDRSDASRSETVDGFMEKRVPFDVEKNDVCRIGKSGRQETATITIVYPAELGIQRAGFTLILAEPQA